MKRKLLLVLMLSSISVNAFANCAAVAKSTTDVMKTGKFTYPGHFEVSINNQTGTVNQYEICTELHSQFQDHTWHSQNSNCYHVTIKPGEGYQRIFDDFTHTTYYHPDQAGNWIFLDAIMRINGECSSVAHENKRVELLRG